MRALLKKELTEVVVRFGLVFVVIVLVWLVSVRFWDALIPPASNTLMIVALSSAVTGAVMGYVQFSDDRWRGRLGYLFHRGTGIDGAFLAKTIVGLLGTTLIGLGPPLLYALSASLFSPNAPILQGSLCWVYASAATAGASLYSLGALAASLRRRAVVGILLIPLGGGALWVISELCGTPWGNASSEWPYPAMHLALAAVILVLVLHLSRAGVDPDLPLPRGVHVAIAALVVPLVLFPCDIGASLLQSSLLSRVRSEYPMIVRDHVHREIFPVVSGEDGGEFRLESDGQLGKRVVSGHALEPGLDAVFWGTGFGASASDPPSDPPALVRQQSFATRGGLTPIWRQQGTYLQHGFVDDDSPPVVRVFLDRERGTVRAFGVLIDPRRQFTAEGIRRAPFAIDVGKTQGLRSFSQEVVVLKGQSDAVGRFLEESAPADLTQVKPGIKVLSCLVDSEDGTCWRLDVLDPRDPLARVELPGGDRYVRLESLYSRNELVYGRYADTWEDPVVVGARGRYEWNGHHFVEALPSEHYAVASEAKNLLECRVVVDDPDPLRWTVRVLDAKDDRELFAYSYAPRTLRGAVAAAAAQATVLLRSPFANTLVSTGVIRQKLDSDLTFQYRSEFLAGGRRPWLWILDVAVGLACAGACARLLRRRNSGPIWIGLGSAFALFFGPVALLVVWLLESKWHARKLPSAAAAHEPALAIQSA